MSWSSLVVSLATLGKLVVALQGRNTDREADGDASDDINKFLWMVRIAQGEWPEEVQEVNYFTQRGEYAVDERA